jgi:hypothetical protein
MKARMRFIAAIVLLIVWISFVIWGNADQTEFVAFLKTTLTGLLAFILSDHVPGSTSRAKAPDPKRVPGVDDATPKEENSP